MKSYMVTVMGLVLAGNMESVVILGLAWWGGEALDERWPLGYPWIYWTILAGLIVVGHTWYIIIRKILEIDREARKSAPSLPKE